MQASSQQARLHTQGRRGGGAGSEHTWEILTGVTFKPTPKISIPVLYRYLDVDYKEGSGLDFFRYDAVEQGVLLGMGFHF